MRRRAFQRCLIGAVSWAACAAATAHYECRMVDGTVISSVQDLSQGSLQAVQVCTPVATQVAITAPFDAVSANGSSPFKAAWPETFGIRIIVRPNWRNPTIAAKLSSEAEPSAAYQELIEQAASRHGVDPLLVRAMMAVESAGQRAAVSPKGARGLMQIMPATGARFGVADASELFNPAVNIDVGVRYLRTLQNLFPARFDLVVAAYNAGESAVLRAGGNVPAYEETKAYVVKVLGRYETLLAQR